MNVNQVSGHEATLTFSDSELRILNNAMNEALEALASDEDEFSTRMGASTADVQALLAAVNAVVRQLG